jgi:hypothetical protein
MDVTKKEDREFVKQRMKDFVLKEYGKCDILGNHARNYAAHEFLWYEDAPYGKETIFFEIYEEIKQEMNIGEDGILKVD